VTGVLAHQLRLELARDRVHAAGARPSGLPRAGDGDDGPRFRRGLVRRLKETLDRQTGELTERNEQVRALQGRLAAASEALQVARQERLHLEAELRKLKTARDESERVAGDLAAALTVQDAALAELERALRA
jgi:chromosome segregation ATPase